MSSTWNWVSSTLMLCTCSLIHADAASAPNYTPVHREITPLAGPVVHNWAEFFITADFIYWKAQMEGLSYAQDGNYAFGQITLPSSAHAGQVKHVDFGWEPGFKAAVGVDFRHDGWYLLANYTWLEHFNASGLAHNNPRHRGQLIGTFSTTLDPDDPVTIVALDSAKAKWKLRFNVIDMELGRSFYISQSLVLQPYVGMKYAWIDQKYKLFYDLFDSARTLQIHEKQDYWGLGLRGGLNTQWHFTRNWSIFGQLAISELYGQFQETRKDVAGGENPGIAAFEKDQFHTIKPVLEMALGIRYETFFSDDRYQLFFQAGWEEQIWFDQNQFIDSGNRASKGDLVFQGLDIKAGFSF